MTVQKLDIVFSALLILLGGIIMAYAYRYGFLDNGIPGAGMFPMLAGLLIAGCSVVNLARQISRRSVRPGVITFAELVPIFAICILLLVFVYLSRFFGVILQLPFVLVAMSYLLEPRRGVWPFVQITVISVLFTVFAYYLFENWLGVLFPVGPLGF